MSEEKTPRADATPDVSDEETATETTAASTASVELAQRVSEMSPDQLKTLLEESRIVIRPGGEVVIENLTADLLDVAYELDPDNPGIQCRVDATDGPDETEDETADEEEGR